MRLEQVEKWPIFLTIDDDDDDDDDDHLLNKQCVDCICDVIYE
jgi:hypothetical protein